MRNIVIILIFSPLFLSAQRVNKIPPKNPKLIVGIVVEQMRYDYLYKYWDKFSEDGFKKLVNNGTVCKNAHFDYVYTQSAPGYATISTGTNPSLHGIIADRWYNRIKDKEERAVYDSKYKTLGKQGKDDTESSPIQLIASTLGDELKLANNNRSKSISIAMDAHAAILSAGHIADGVYWFDEVSGSWVTSNFYTKQMPVWVNTFNDKKLAEMYSNRVWETSLSIEKYTESLGDKSKYEIGLSNQTIFPYQLSKFTDKFKPFAVLKAVPNGNTLTKDFAIHAILEEQLGKDDFTDLLQICFTPPQEIGLKFGSQSVELADMYIKLDAEIAFFLNFLDSNIGTENVVVYLTSNHGVAQSPRYMEDLQMPAGFFKSNKALALLKSYLSALYGEGEWVKYYYKGQIYLDHILIENSKLSLNVVRENVARFMVQFTGVANALSASTLENTGYAEGVFRQMLLGYNQKRSGDVFLNLEAGWIEHTLSQVSDHNSGYSYDTHVPLIWYGWKIERKTIDQKVSMTGIAPTISSMLNIATPTMSSESKIIDLFVK